MKATKALFELIQLLEISEDTDVLLERLIFHIAELMNAQSAILRLMKDKKLYVAKTFNLQSYKQEIDIDEGLCGKAIKKGKVKIFNKEELEKEEADIPAYSAICLPLAIKKTDLYKEDKLLTEKQIIGTIIIYNKINSEEGMVEFTEDDIELGEVFSSIASLIIQKSIHYKELNELKSYLESLIHSSADAIVATDLNNVVTAWNKGAEAIFKYKKEEVIGKPLLVIPDFLADVEKQYLEKIKQGETLKDIETIRVTKDNKLIEVSLTLSPIKNVAGEIVGVSRIARDITEKKKLERELIRRNEELTKIIFVSSVVRSTLSLNKLLRMILTVITMGEGLGFNRAALFLLDEETNTLKGKMAVGPSSFEEAWQIWSSLSKSKKSLYEVLEEMSTKELEEDSLFEITCKNIVIPLDNNTPMVKAVKEKKVFNIKDVSKEEVDPIIIQQLGSFAYAIVPLISKEKTIGTIWVDNLFTHKPITEQDINFLKGFADQVAGAIENAWIFEKVEQAEKEIEMLFNSISDLLYYTDEFYSIKKVNKAFLKKIGLEEKDVINKKCFQLIHKTDYPLKNCPHREAMESKKEKIGEIEENYLDGVYSISSSPIFDKESKLKGTINLARDITEITNLRKKLVHIEKMAALGEMAAKVAHEIRNPLLALGGFAKRLDKEIEDERQKEYAKIIVNETRRLERILNETLSFVSPQPLSKTPFKLNKLIYDIGDLTESTVKSNNNKLLIEANEKFLILGSYDRLKEVILNLITNANEATKGGTITLRLKEGTELIKEKKFEGRFCVIEVEDTGSGISKENLKKIFNPFFTTKVKGTGLGLAISKKIIEEHGGIIEVKSEENKGTIFWIYLPIYKGGISNENNGGG
jgi:PAS domain S-box-containing protein